MAEHTEVHLLPRAAFETVERDGFVYIAGLRSANLHPYRVDDAAATVEWSRAESRRRGHRDVEWWLGWRAEPAELAEQLLELGLARSDDPPTLTGMTCSTEPPGAAGVEVRRVETVDDYAAAVEVDWDVWQLSAEERAGRRELDIERYDEMYAHGTVHHFTAFLGGRRVGVGRAIALPTAVARYGGAVLPEARGRGVYRALVHARWNHAVERGTPVLVVQAGPMSAPALDRFGFERHGDIHLYSDRL
ncbi:MAG: GNAT family N-acetyltransferase [Thermoleophilia bacterium]|nr:GNAT family N-acetyltransferase [Thermoleophilia bacterium]